MSCCTSCAFGGPCSSGKTGIGLSMITPQLVGVISTPILPSQTLSASLTLPQVQSQVVTMDEDAEKRSELSVIDDAKDLLKQTHETTTSLLKLGVFGVVAYLLLR